MQRSSGDSHVTCNSLNAPALAEKNVTRLDVAVDEVMPGQTRIRNEP